jgi:hypothetical protein
MRVERKITVHVDRALLTGAQKATRGSISETVRKGLEVLAANEAYDQLLKLRGRVKFSVDLSRLRADK